MGWEYIDDIVWVKPEPSAKNRVAGFNMHRKPLAYKPNCVTESIMVYRKKSNKLIDWIFKQYPDEIVKKSKVKDGYETSNVWHIDPSFDKKHSAIFPLELCEKVINYYSLEGDLIFDPFAGSGSVGVAAKKNNRNFFLTEIDKNYFNLIKEKLSGDLFGMALKIGLNKKA
jgi:DNA modification methylase